MAKWILGILLILAIAAGGFAIYKAVTRLEAKVAEVEAQAAKTIAEKEALIASKEAENIVLREKDAAAQLVKLQLQADLQAKTIENDKLRKNLRTAPPETVLATVQGYLNTTEIWLRWNAVTEVEAVFSLAAFRLDADALAERQYLKFTLVPSIEAQFGESEKQNGIKAAIIVSQQTIIGYKDEIIGQKDMQIVVRDDSIKALKKINLWREFRDFGFGALVATILTLIFGK